MASMLGWFAISSSSGSRFVRTLHYDPSPQSHSMCGQVFLNAPCVLENVFSAFRQRALPPFDHPLLVVFSINFLCAQVSEHLLLCVRVFFSQKCFQFCCLDLRALLGGHRLLIKPRSCSLVWRPLSSGPFVHCSGTRSLSLPPSPSHSLIFSAACSVAHEGSCAVSTEVHLIWSLEKRFHVFY